MENQTIYEVTVVVDKESAEKVESFIEKHVNEVVLLDNGTLFKSGTINKLKSTDTNSNTVSFINQYYPVSQQTLEHYFKVHGPRISREVKSEFQDKNITITPRVYTVFKEFLSTN
ncbi:hypothetical protein PPL_07778 [Heterostelium album PN500]|uniref:Uncharacterized protein n=1 Tax=Heterostelium pallidum (strain ATCC 26659 / Pp 5 / PN500) TaxID=670386 RepID=D3BGX6_HETP5|nr:hypothetical protein PPL_07778 [Heterostelium album PN500]EFA79360.1 hypothetical protein PPL_07778 [Heterostelium album PN500]|eukprot:XP_020431481.1 hypothetical protein PPL_07778 [Heterostelium album PN500]